jgi:hypothetical protein
MSERIVEVEWEDAASTHGWHEADDLPESWTIHSVGYVERDDGRGIRLTEGKPQLEGRQKKGARDYGCTTMIPRSAIRKVTELKRGRRN